MSEGITVTSSKHEAALERLMSTSKKTAEEVLTQRARIVFKTVAQYTPPSHAGVLGRSAETHAKAKVASDIHGLYGTPNEAYDAVAEKSPGEARAFWYLLKHGDIGGASGIMRAATGSIIAPFDDGAHHRRNFRRRGNKFRFFVSDPKNLKAYVQLEQEQVWWLASGWEDALSALGVKGIPYGVGKHAAPGTLRVEITDQRIVITMVNQVGFASRVKDINRRILWAMNQDADTMQRMWDAYMEKLAGQAGMKATP